MSTAPFSEDALNRYRITHSDRDLKPLLRRLHRLPLLASPQQDGPSAEVERDLVRMELLKWRAGVERVMGSIANLERQTEVYRRQAQETVQRTEQLRQTLAREKEELEKKRKLREHQVKCDEIAKRITARGKSRAELDEQISTLETSLDDHRTSHALYLQTTQARLDTFGQITKLIDDCRALKLPLDPASSLEEEKMDVDPTVVAAAADSVKATKLSAAAPVFQPTSSAVPAVTPNAASSSSGRASAPPSQASSLKVPMSGHGLPSRPSNSRSPSGGSKPTRQNSALPNRPSNLRSSTTPGGLQGGSLEDGEVGPEEGEVADESRKRSRGSEASSRNTRTRAK
ncbi:hypothetical protein IAU60_006079 [Kwoniella sp. DSM 27419]